MLKRTKSAWLGRAFVVSLSLSLLPQTIFAADEDILVTDPSMLETLGFDRDAKNIYLAPGIDLEGASGNDFSTAFEPEAPSRPSGLAIFIGSAIVSGREFQARRDISGTDWRYGTDPFGEQSSFGPERIADAQITDLPHTDGYFLHFLHASWFDGDEDSDLLILLFEVCKPVSSAGESTVRALALLSSAGSNSYASGEARLFPSEPLAIRDCLYIARAIFPENPREGTSHRLIRVGVTYTGSNPPSP